MQFLKPRTVRLYPKLRRWILTDAASSGSSLQPRALAINKRLADEAGRSNENLVFSPLSIYAAPSLVAAEARKRTLAEMLDVLGARSRDDLAGSVRALAEQALANQSPAGGPHVSFACAGWHDKTRPLKPDYADAAVKSYKAQTCAVDFHEKPKEAGKQINAWVEASTNKIIPSIVDPDKLSNLTDLAVANAIYFKGEFFLFFQQKRVPLQFH